MGLWDSRAALDRGLELWLGNGQIICIDWSSGFGAYHLAVFFGAYYLQQEIQHPRNYEDYRALPELPDSYYEEVTQSVAWAPLIGVTAKEVATYWDCGWKKPGIVEIVFANERTVWFCSAEPSEAAISGGTMSLDADHVIVVFAADVFERSFGHLLEGPRPYFYAEVRSCGK